MADFVAALVLMALAVAAFPLADRVNGGTFRAFSASFAAYRTDHWPLGVQEENPDRPWGRNATLPRDDDRQPTAEVMRVHGVVTARRRGD